MDQSLAEETALALNKSWQVKVDDGAGSEWNWEWLLKALAGRIHEMLENDFEGLINAMYRMDVAERDFRKAMQGESLELMSLNIARLVMEREKQKVITRRKYREGL